MLRIISNSNPILKTVFSFIFISLIFFSYYNRESSSGSTTITAVDGYVKDGVVTDSVGQIAPYSANNGKYTFTNNPTYPIKLTGGILEDTNEIFDIEMTTQSGLIISPITTFIDADDAIRKKLTNKGFAHITSIEGFSVDYINTNNTNLSKLAQLLYVILRDKKLISAFKDKLDDQRSNLSDLFKIAIKTIEESKLTKNTKIASRRFLNFAKDYNGTAIEMEQKLKVSKNKLVHADKVSSSINEDIFRDKNIDNINISDSANLDNRSSVLRDKTDFNKSKTTTTNSKLDNETTTTTNSKLDNETTFTSNSKLDNKTTSANLIVYASNATSVKDKEAKDKEVKEAKEAKDKEAKEAKDKEAKDKEVKDNGEVPILSDFSTYINDNVSKGTNIGNISILNSGDTNIKSYTLNKTTNFIITKNGVVLTNSTFDYKTTKSYNLTVYATNNAGNSESVDFKVSLYKNKKTKLVDSAVQGVNYETDTGKTGITDREGEFPYDTRDKTVTFKIGSLIIAKDFNFSKINSDDAILPADIVGVDRNNTEDKNMIKILRVVQSLDNDNNPANGILIDDNTKGYLSINANIVDTNISILKTMVEAAGKTFKSEREARQHYMQTLRDIAVTPVFRPFITVWKTKLEDESITILIDSTKYAYNYTVDWGDGYINRGIHRSVIHKYSNAGEYTVKISGNFPSIKAENNKQIQMITQWGDIVWEDFSKSFKNCTNLDVNATDIPDLSNVHSTDEMFYKADNLRGNKYFNNWDVSKVINMKGMFQLSSFNQPINNWDVSKVLYFNYMFEGAEAFNQALNDWNVSKAQNMEGMFKVAKAFNQPLNNWNVSNVTTMKGMFDTANKFNRDISSWDVSSVTSMEYMFADAFDFNQPLNNWDVSSVTNMGNMFQVAKSFNQPLYNWNVSNVTKMLYMFYGAITFSDQNLGAWNVTKVTDHDNFILNAGNGNTQPTWR